MPIDDDDDISAELSNMERLLDKEPAHEVDDLQDERFSTEPDEPEEKLSRDEKKRQRLGILQSLREKDNENAVLRDRLEALERRPPQRAEPQQPQQSGPPPLRAFLDNVSHQQDVLAKAYLQEQGNGSLTPEREQHYRQQHRYLDEQKAFAIAKSAQEPVDTGQQAIQAIQRANMARNADVYGNEQVRRWAGAQYALLEAEYTQPNGQLRVDPQELHDLVMKQARRKFRIERSGVSEPSQADRRRHSGSSRSASPAGPQRNTIVMKKEYKEMADVAYSHIKDEKERYRTWAREVGSELRK